jgi:hypothetical protein
MIRYARRWFLKDPDAARAWIEEADLSPELRKRIHANLPGARRPAAAAKVEADG